MHCNNLDVTRLSRYLASYFPKWYNKAKPNERGMENMKVVINTCFGGFSISEKVAQAIGTHDPYCVLRYAPELIEAVEKDPKSASGAHAKLKVVEIPQNATDWEISEYDGLEHIICVIDGKLHHLS